MKREHHSDEKLCLVLRFLGTTPNTSSLLQLLFQLCQQILFITGRIKTKSGEEYSVENIPMKFQPLASRFKELLLEIPKSFKFVLILDSLDQLNESNISILFNWIPSKLQSNVKMILTCLENEQRGILNRLKEIFKFDEQAESAKSNFIKIHPLSQDLAKKMIKHSLEKMSRNLTQEQEFLVDEALAKCSLPLYVKLLLELIQGWKSFDNFSEIRLPLTLIDSINEYFRSLEKQFGQFLISKVIGYLESAKAGLTESEIDDVLSLDEDLLNIVFDFWLPPIRRIPAVLLVRILQDMRPFLVRREADKVITITFYHRIFFEVARNRYLNSISVRQQCHSLIADYFLGIQNTFYFDN